MSDDDAAKFAAKYADEGLLTKHAGAMAKRLGLTNADNIASHVASGKLDDYIVRELADAMFKDMREHFLQKGGSEMVEAFEEGVRSRWVSRLKNLAETGEGKVGKSLKMLGKDADEVIENTGKRAASKAREGFEEALEKYLKQMCKQAAKAAARNAKRAPKRHRRPDMPKLKDLNGEDHLHDDSVLVGTYVNQDGPDYLMRGEKRHGEQGWLAIKVDDKQGTYADVVAKNEKEAREKGAKPPSPALANRRKKEGGSEEASA
jgi:hypothetical protein